ncbi:MAG TPA: hypothetical protein VGS58_05700, partial [Candidatus Sulfopaludibacter sp.]|nr:hypothetical protein [Candidatus Sulfopaludibacter sp.]
QVARWIRLGEPQVRPDDSTFGLIGTGGKRWAWYGIGQSLLLAPFDFIVSTAAAPALDRFRLTPEKREQAVELLIAFLMQSFLAAGSLAQAYEILILLGFTAAAGMAGTLALLCATTWLAYLQSAQENSLLLLTALLALYGILRCRETGGARWAALAGAACGMAILTRLPSLLETGVFFVAALFLGCHRRQFCKGYLPPVLASLLADRWYQWYRFGDPFSTYMRPYGQQLRQPGDPASFPFSYPFWKGFLATLFSPDKSIFLFDPLLLLLIAVVAWKWREIHRPVRIVLLALAAWLLAYIALYARYYDFGGDVAWGHRFVVVPVELLALFSVPLLISSALPRPARGAAWALVCVSLVVQASSTTLAPNVEVAQRGAGSHAGVLVNRFLNLAELAARGAHSPRFAGLPAAWRTLYYLPFQLRFRFPQLASWAIAGWLALLIALPFAALGALRMPGRQTGPPQPHRDAGRPME